MSHTQALYYPWIDIRNSQWLKTSALFWDKIQTIVPSSIDAPYEDITTREFEDAGILIPLRVDSNMTEIESLSDDVLRYLSSDEAANLLFSTEKRKSVYLHPEKLPRSIRNLTRLHPEKMDSQIRYIMEELGFSRRRGDWMEVDGEFASFYMTLLATRLSERLGLGLLTDSSSSHRLSSKAKADSEISSVYGPDYDYHEFRARMRRRDAPRALAEGMMVDLILEQIGIDPNTPTYEILEFSANSKGSNAKDKDLPILADSFPVTLDLPQDMSERSLGAHNAVAQHQKAFMSPTRRGFCSSDGSESFEFGICRTVFYQILGSASKTIIRIGISNCNNAPNSPEFG